MRDQFKTMEQDLEQIADMLLLNGTLTGISGISAWKNGNYGI